MTTTITPDYFFVAALPTPTWSKVLRYCQTQPNGDGQLSLYKFDAQAGLTIDVKPFNLGPTRTSQLPCGTFFSERYHEHTFADVVQAIREGSLDSKVLTYPELLSGQDTMVVYFWPDEEDDSQDRTGNDAHLQRKADELFQELVAQAIQHL